MKASLVFLAAAAVAVVAVMEGDQRVLNPSTPSGADSMRAELVRDAVAHAARLDKAYATWKATAESDLETNRSVLNGLANAPPEVKILSDTAAETKKTAAHAAEQLGGENQRLQGLQAELEAAKTKTARASGRQRTDAVAAQNLVARRVAAATATVTALTKTAADTSAAARSAENALKELQAKHKAAEKAAAAAVKAAEKAFREENAKWQADVAAAKASVAALK